MRTMLDLDDKKFKFTEDDILQLRANNLVRYMNSVQAENKRSDASTSFIILCDNGVLLYGISEKEISGKKTSTVDLYFAKKDLVSFKKSYEHYVYGRTSSVDYDNEEVVFYPAYIHVSKYGDSHVITGESKEAIAKTIFKAMEEEGFRLGMSRKDKHYTQLLEHIFSYENNGKLFMYNKAVKVS